MRRASSRVAAGARFFKFRRRRLDSLSRRSLGCPTRLRRGRDVAKVAVVQSSGHDPKRQRERSEQFRYAGLGLEFGAGIAGCVLLGYWVDRTFGTANKGVVIGAIVGCVGGMYHLVTRAMRIQRKYELDRRSPPRGVQDDPGPDANEPGPDA